MNKKEVETIKESYKAMFKDSMALHEQVGVSHMRELLDNLGLKKERYDIENEIILENNNFNEFTIGMFKMFVNEFVKYGKYSHYDLIEIKDIFDEVKYEMSDDESSFCQTILEVLTEEIKKSGVEKICLHKK